MPAWYQVVCTESFAHGCGTHEIGWYPRYDLADEAKSQHVRDNPRHEVQINKHYKSAEAAPQAEEGAESAPQAEENAEAAVEYVPPGEEASE